MPAHTEDPAAGDDRPASADALAALVILGLGIFTIVAARSITVPVSSNVVGPRVFPYAVGAALVLAGSAVLIGALRGRVAEPEGGEDVDPNAPADWRTFATLLGGFSLHVLVVDLLGWALAGALLFAVVAWALGARPATASVVGLVLGFSIQIVFVSGLGVTLPAGVFEGVPLLRG